MDKQIEKIDYTQYSFRPEEDVAIKAGALSQIFRTINELLEREGVGFTTHTSARYEYVHKETSALAKPNTKRETLDKDYKKVFSMTKTMGAEAEIVVTEAGKALFSLLQIIDEARITNLNAGKGTLISTLQAEAEDKNRRLQESMKKMQGQSSASLGTQNIGLKPRKGKASKTEVTKDESIKVDSN